MKIPRNNIFPISLLFFTFCLVSHSQVLQENLGNGQNFEWTIASFLKESYDDVEISGNPKIISSPFGDAVYFDGVDDAVFLDANPLESFNEFTIEMIFNPAMDGDFEQRVVHMGEVSQDRMLLEIRAENETWYFDGFVASKGNKRALIDSTLVHPLGKWQHVAFVVAPNSLTTYVNGKKELHEAYSFHPIKTGKSSVGVRLNKRSWFKGSIYKIKISPKILEPKDFLDFEI